MHWLLLWRFSILLVSCASVFFLLRRFYKFHDSWNTKTRDYWYALFMWSISGVGVALEGILRQSPFRFVLVIITAAAIVTLIGVIRRGTWGSKNDE